MNRHLFNNLSRYLTRQSVDQMTAVSGFFRLTFQIFARDLNAVITYKNTVLNRLVDQIIFHCAFVFQINIRIAAARAIQRRLRDINISPFDQFGHLAEKERQQKRADMRSVNVRIGHDNDFMIPAFVRVKIIAADSGAERRNHRADFRGI